MRKILLQGQVVNMGGVALQEGEKKEMQVQWWMKPRQVHTFNVTLLNFFNKVTKTRFGMQLGVFSSFESIW
jgi:hypothetical protein